MPRPVTVNFGGEPYQYTAMGNYVVKAKGVCGGRPTFIFTRILVSGVLDRINAGDGLETIIKSYRGRVSKDAIREAINLFSKPRSGSKSPKSISTP